MITTVNLTSITSQLQFFFLLWGLLRSTLSSFHIHSWFCFWMGIHALHSFILQIGSLRTEEYWVQGEPLRGLLRHLLGKVMVTRSRVVVRWDKVDRCVLKFCQGKCERLMDWVCGEMDRSQSWWCLSIWPCRSLREKKIEREQVEVGWGDELS